MRFLWLLLCIIINKTYKMKKKIYTLGALLALFSAGLKAQISFQPGVSYFGGINTTDIASGDFNNDGIKDIVTNNLNPGNYDVFTGSNTGTFSTGFNSAAIAFQPYRIAVADFNNDGKLDLVHTNNFNSAQVRYGTGTSSFSLTSSAFTTGSNLLDLIVDDFNNDTKPDIVTANNNASNITIALCSPTGTFGAATNFTVGAFPYSLTSGDFNNDGNKDVAVCRGTSTSGSVTVLFGNGTGSFGTPVHYVTGLGPRSVKAADFNGDGNLDLAVANYDSNNISILLGSSTGTFATAINYNVISQPTSLVCVDIDGDTKIDLAVTNSNNVSILKGSGLGTFSGGVNFTIPGGSGLRLIASNFNNDTKVDLAVTQYNGMAVFLNTSVCTASISVSSGTICSGQSFTIAPIGASTYSYSGGSAVVSPTTSTIYTVTGTTSLGCVGFATSNVVVTSSPTVSNVTSGGNNFCSGSSTSIYASGISGGTPPFTYTWSNGSSNSTPIVTLSVTTSFSLVVTDALGCKSNSAAVTVTVLPDPTVTITSSSPTLCAGQSATITITGNVATTFTGNLNNTTPAIPGGAAALSGYYVITPTVNTYQQILVNQSGTCTKYFYYNQIVQNCAPAGINEFNTNNLISIYPNPASNFVTVNLGYEPTETTTLSVINALGKTILMQQATLISTDLKTENLSNGIYFIKVENKNNSVIKKFVKQ
jgi:hypothetical protein